MSAHFTARNEKGAEAGKRSLILAECLERLIATISAFVYCVRLAKRYNLVVLVLTPYNLEKPGSCHDLNFHKTVHG